jgi:hypothetical protein
MSFADVLAEIPRLTPEQRREVLRVLCDTLEESTPAGFQLHRDSSGRVTLSSPQVIRQADVDAVLKEFP